MDEKKLPRDAFIDEIFEAAQKNKNIFFISADLGAAALDRFRDELDGQFIHAGISEQNMVDLAAGLAISGKIVYLYAMVPFVTLRCYEQIKVALATMNLPATILGVGAGYSYDDAGPTHYGTEDVSAMRALGNIEILSPGDHQSTLEAARLTYQKPALRYVRLDRKHLPTIYGPTETRFLKEGICEIDKGDQVCIFTTGYMVQKARAVRERLAKEGINVGVADVFRMKPINLKSLAAIASRYRKIVTLEEHFLSGGLGSSIAEAFADAGITLPLKRIGINDRYCYENGGREYLHKICGIDVETVSKQVKEFQLSDMEPSSRG